MIVWYTNVLFMSLTMLGVTLELFQLFYQSQFLPLAI